ACCLAGIDEREDVRMSEARRDPDLAQEPLGPERRSELRAEDLDRDVAAVFPVLREVDGGHAAPAEEAAQLVPLGQGGRQIGWNVGGGLHGREIWRPTKKCG